MQEVVVKIEGFSLRSSNGRENFENLPLNGVTIKKEPGFHIDNQDMLMKINWLKTQLQPVLFIKRLSKSEIFKPTKKSKSKGKIKNLQNLSNSNENCGSRHAEDVSINQYEKILIKYERASFKQEMIIPDQLENIFNHGPAVSEVKSFKFEPILKIKLGEIFGKYQDQGETIQIKIHEKPTIDTKKKVKKKVKRPYKCLLCSKCFTGFENLSIHMRTHTREKPYFCKKCPKSFVELAILKRHKYMHKGKKPFSCTECLKMFAHKGHLNQHRLVHSGEKPFSCSICQRAFAQKWVLRKHEETRNSQGLCKGLNTENKPVKCSICSVMFKNSLSLTLHMRVHKENLNLPHKCTFCTNSYTSKAYLQIHLGKHTADKKLHTCRTCSKSFTTNSSLTRHCTAIHFKEKGQEGHLKCPECPKTFFLKENLKSHSRIHSNVKEFGCPFCNEKYRHRQNLNTHIKFMH